MDEHNTLYWEKRTGAGSMAQGYAEAALFGGMAWKQVASESPENPEPLDTIYSFEDISQEAWAAIESLCNAFTDRAGRLLERAVSREGYGMREAGMDLYFTSAGHGVGFWDREELGRLGEQLSTIVRSEFGGYTGEADLQEGDDGKLHFQFDAKAKSHK